VKQGENEGPRIGEVVENRVKAKKNLYLSAETIRRMLVLQHTYALASQSAVIERVIDAAYAALPKGVRS